MTDPWASADAVTHHILDQYRHWYEGELVILSYLKARGLMSATMVKLPDGSEVNGADATCEDCGKPVSDHSCGGSGGTVVVSGATRSTGPRKKPEERPPCPDCGGAVHFSMPGGLQNVECIMRQWYLDNEVIKTPNDRLPLYGLDDLAEAVEWAKDLKDPITYGRMESAAGGSGTYASLRPKAEKVPDGKRKRKAKPAAAGEKIEDLAAEAEEDLALAPAAVATEEPKRRRKGRAAPVEAIPEPVPATRARRTRPVAAPVVDPTVTADANAVNKPTPITTSQQEREERRAKRRALLAGNA